jgi:hypothetical protein
MHSVFALTHLPETWDTYNGIRTSENDEKFVWINIIFFLNLAFGQVGEKNKAKTGSNGVFSKSSKLDLRSKFACFYL